MNELLELWVEARTADPKAEVILMPRCTATMSAIATDASVTWGKGNDGVTAGGEQWDIPCPNANLTKVVHRWDQAYRQDIKGGAFLEIVENNGIPTIVQVRDGPVITKATGNFIPHADYKVANVIYMKDADATNLLAWEKLIQEAPKGSVLVLPNAGLSSHFAVHGIVHGHAVITGPKHEITEKLVVDGVQQPRGPKVKVGDVLQPDSDQPAKLRNKDYKAMRLMLRKGMPFTQKEAPGFATAVLHSMGMWGRERHLLALRVVGAVSMLRLLTAACVGEARHFGCRSDRSTVKPKIPWKELMGRDLDWSGRSDHCGDEYCAACNRTYGSSSARGRFNRQAVFDKALEWPVDKLVDLADAAREDLSGPWGGVSGENNKTQFDEKGEIIPQDMSEAKKSNTGYGGPRWRASAEVVVRFGKAIQEFQKKPCEETWMKVCARYNEGVACAHNGGRLLDKFAEWSHIDLCAKAPQFGFISRAAYETINLFKAAKRAQAEPVPELILDESTVVGRKPMPPTPNLFANFVAAGGAV